MKTKKDGRAALKQRLEIPLTGGPTDHVSLRENMETTLALIADVEEAVALLGLLRRGELGIWPHDHEIHGCKLCDRWEMVDDFLKEPSEGGM